MKETEPAPTNKENFYFMCTWNIRFISNLYELSWKEFAGSKNIGKVFFHTD